MYSRYSHVNLPMLARVVGWLLMIEAAFMLMPLGMSLYHHEQDINAFAITTAVTFVTGLTMTTLIRPRRTEMGKREGFLLTALVWVVFSLFGMLPFMLGGNRMGVSDAFFEAMSGFTTTGASILTDLSRQTHGILLWRALMQWIGGMGIILFTLAVVPMLNSSGGMQMFNAEVTGITHEKLRPRISQTAKSLWYLYFILTVLLAVLLWLGPMDAFESVCHALGTISTGGFSTRADSIEDFDSIYIDVVITVFMFLGGVNFALLIKGITGQPGKLWRSDVFRTYVTLIAVMMALFVINILARGQYHGIKSITIDPLFQIVSTITSTGYTDTNFESWGSLTMALVFVMMFFGACAGSTSGGAKIDRLLLLKKNIQDETYRILHPNSVKSVRMGGKPVSPDIVSKVIAFLCIYTIVIVIGGIALTALDLPLVDSFFSSFSAMSNTGLGSGVTGYGGGNFTIIPAAGKWVLSFIMLVGRLEIFTVLVLFTPGFWRR